MPAPQPTFWRRAIHDRQALLRRTATLAPRIARLIDAVAEVLTNGGTLFFFGNGGSAADAQHAAAEFVGRFETERDGLPAIALTTDTSVLTAIGNDYGVARVFERQIESLARPGDLVIGISTSGNSENVVRGFRAARRRGAQTAALLGRGGGRAKALADLAIVVPAARVSLTQEVHEVILHVLCEEIERRLRRG